MERSETQVGHLGRDGRSRDGGREASGSRIRARCREPADLGGDVVDAPVPNVGSRAVLDGKGGAEERARTELYVDAVHLGEGRPRLPIRQAEAGDLDSAAPDLQIEAV